MQYKLIAKCLFGLEKTLAYEVRSCGGTDTVIDNGAVMFTGDERVIAVCNMACRVAERVGILLGRFPACTFDEVFDYVRGVDLRGVIERGGAFPVKAGHSLDSALTSIPAIQRTIKKALAENLSLRGVPKDAFDDIEALRGGGGSGSGGAGKSRPGGTVDESGAVYPVVFNIRKNIMELYIDTSGDSLHKRGYRQAPSTVSAPLRETLAAGIIDLCRVKAGTQLIDPFCGSGTILIEAALKVRRIPPCLNRDFTSVHFRGFGRHYRSAREELRDNIITDTGEAVPVGYDNDPAAVAVALANARAAGVTIDVTLRDIRDFAYSGGSGAVVVTNPPYGERLSTPAEVAELYGIAGGAFADCPGIAGVNILSPQDDFCALYNKHRTLQTDFRNRKLYNGALQVRLYSSK